MTEMMRPVRKIDPRLAFLYADRTCEERTADYARNAKVSENSSTGRKRHSVQRARERGTYEHFREELTNLRRHGVALSVIAVRWEVSLYRVEYLCTVLRIGRNGHEMPDIDAES